MQAAFIDSTAERQPSHPDAREVLCSGLDPNIHFVAGIYVADIYVAGLEDEPVVRLTFGAVGKMKLEHETWRQIGRKAKVSSDIPHQEIGIDIFKRRLGIDPLLTPFGDTSNDRSKRCAGLGQTVVSRFPASFRVSGDKACLFKLLEPL